MKILKTKTNFVFQSKDIFLSDSWFICIDVALCFSKLYLNSNKVNTAYGTNFRVVQIKTGVTVISRAFSLAVILL